MDAREKSKSYCRNAVAFFNIEIYYRGGAIMLEFQEGFFEQEVRDGFYLDVTIKTLWASEMELLNKIAEVCAKYDLKWYAAYGTLLGAIRHEGFVPWDDDMDIWMMRKDYNKLMKVLQNELPEDYHVRSPQTETGYDQFHTCVNNGSGISIAKSWLEANHNCPFTVGIDIFPLDYLPRNKKDRELQKSIFILVGRVAQVAKNIHRGDFDKEDATMTKEEAIAQIKEGLEYLKKNYKFSLDMKWIENEEWDKVASEVWKWGNYVASMYEEDESDYIVEYLDWARWELKKFPKTWFKEIYSASFEGFMLPIPSGYDCLLKLIYGEYMHFIPKLGCHEYPFYARQLRQLREYVKNVEERAENVGVISIDEVVVKDKHDIPDEWINYTIKEDGTKKKIILMANNPSEYLLYGKEAIDNLQRILDAFKKMKEDVLLWWRPHATLQSILRSKDVSLAKRYESILQLYKEEAWGICDELEDIEIAIEACDAYYGEMNAVVQRIQNYPKPVMLLQLHQETEILCSNENRLREGRAFFALSDCVEIDGKEYFANTNYNSLVKANKETGEIEKVFFFDDIPLTSANYHERCIEKDGKILFLPVGEGIAHIFNISTENIISVQLTNGDEHIDKKTWEYMTYDKEIYLFPPYAKQGLWKWNVGEDSIELVKWWKINSDVELMHCNNGNKMFSLVGDTNLVYVTDFEHRRIDTCKLPDRDVTNFVYDGFDYWYSVSKKNEIIRWNETNGNRIAYSLKDYECFYDTKAFLKFAFCGSRLFVVSQEGNAIYEYDRSKDLFTKICELENVEGTFTWLDKEPHFKLENNIVRVYYRNMDVYWNINPSSEQIITINEGQKLEIEHQKLRYRLMVEKNELMFDDGNDCNLWLFVNSVNCK